MKYLRMALGIAVISLWALNAQAVDHFTLSLPASAQAGDYVSITIFAENYNTSLDFNYYGTVTITAGSGSGTFSPSVSGNFNNAKWIGTLRVLTADNPWQMTCTGANGTTGNAAIIITTGPAVKQLVVFPGQTYTPGLDPGVTPSLPAVYAGDYNPVTVYAVDQFWNWRQDFVGTFNLSTVVPDSDIKPHAAPGIYPEGTYNATDGRGFFSVAIGHSGMQAVTSTQPFNNTQPVNVQSLTSIYLRIDAPSQVTAGATFYLDVTAYTTALLDSVAYVGDTVKLGRYLQGNSNPATGDWSPSENITLTNGYCHAAFSYNRAETIYLVPEKLATEEHQILGNPSANITIVANTPVAPLEITVTPEQIESQGQAVIGVVVHDEFGNLVPNATVNFEKTQGAADSTLAPASALTDVNGRAQSVFTGGRYNETGKVKVTVNAIEQEISIRISVAPVSGDQMVNYPNPFDPNQEKTLISYFLKAESEVEIKIYDAFGRLVLGRSILPGQGSGDYANASLSGGASFLWDGRNGEGKVVANGIYLIKIKAKNSSATQEFKRRVGVRK